MGLSAGRLQGGAVRDLSMSKDANKGEEVQVGCCYGVTVFTKDMKALSDVRRLGLTSQKEGRMITNPNVNLNTRSDDVVDARSMLGTTLEDQLANSAKANGVPMVVASSYTVGISYSTDSMCEKGQAPYCAFGFQVQTTKNADQPTKQQTTKPGGATDIISPCYLSLRAASHTAA